MAVKVLVVDDMVLFRKVVSEALASLPDVEVVGTAGNGKAALARIEALQPDLMTLDLEMPEMDGLEVLRTLKAKGLNVDCIVLSGMSVKGGELTIKALELGAFDFITKPSGGTLQQNRERIRADLAPIVKAYAHRLEVHKILKGQPPVPAPVLAPASAPAAPPAPAASPRPESAADLSAAGSRMRHLAARAKPEIIVLGISTGGPNTLARMLPELPADLGAPVLIVQHMPPNFTRSLAESLDAKCALKVKEAEDGEAARAGVVYIAPGGRHMKLAPLADSSQKIIRITDDPPENNCRPSVDTLFRSVALHFPGRALAVIMTGMGNDGTLGLKLLKRGGCPTIAQDEASCVVFGMPREAIQAGVIDVVAPLERIAAEILKVFR
jgi:two-component system chemotaxis response regulator CheB